MKKIIIPLVEVEIGENLFIRIKDISFIPAERGVTSALPENCYPDEPAEIDWLKENAKLIITKGKDEKEFDIDDSFVCEYYDLIIENIENMEDKEQ